jgi:4-amino-4-deoxy-L-arabinose transferase-like glycosyltransferase
MLAGSSAATGTRVEGVPAAGVLAHGRAWAVHGYRLGVAAVTAALGAFLVWHLHAWPPHEDETLVFFVSRQPFGEVFDTVLDQRGGAPLHFLLAHVVTLVAPGLTGLRLISVAFAVASIPVTAALVARLTDRRTALLAVLFVAASWVTLLHAVYARMYSLFLFTSVLSFLLLVRALERGSAARWTVWGIATLAMLATQPYGALVLAAQAVFVLARRVRHAVPLRAPLVAFGVVAVVAIPLWRTYFVLASRFDVGFGERNGSKLGSPVSVLEYLWKTLGDFTAGWLPVALLVAGVAATGLAVLVRSRRDGALLTVAVVAVPAISLLVARSGASASLETRHLIFALPLFAMLLAVGLRRLARAAGSLAPVVLAVGVGFLLAAQIAWGWERTPWLYAGEPEVRVEAREAAASWLASTSRPEDVLFGYEPTYLDAWEKGAPFGSIFIPRADPKLALAALRRIPQPLGRGVWVLDASDHLDQRDIRLSIQRRSPGEEFEARAFGPFLVIRTLHPTGTIENYLVKTNRVQHLSWALGVGDAAINFQTAFTALRRLRETSE